MVIMVLTAILVGSIMGLIGTIMISDITERSSKTIGGTLLALGLLIAITSLVVVSISQDAKVEESLKDSTGIVISSEYVPEKESKRGVDGYEVLMWDDKESEITLFYEGNSFPYASGDRVEYTTQIDLRLKDEDEGKESRKIYKISKLNMGDN